jgi:hypothetical protein
MFAILRFQRRLQRPQLISIHLFVGRTPSKFGAWRKRRYYFVGLMF